MLAYACEPKPLPPRIYVCAPLPLQAFRQPRRTYLRTSGNRRVNPSQAPTRSRTPLIKFSVLLLLIIAGWLLVSYSPLTGLLEQSSLSEATEQVKRFWWTPLLLLLGYTLFGLAGIPAPPLFVVGAVFGPVMGTLYNLTGLLLGAAAGFTLARILGLRFVLQTAGSRYYKTRRFINRFGFWPLVQARFLPIPDTVLNVTAALSGMPLKRYLFASLVGLLPSTAVHTLCIGWLLQADSNLARSQIGAGYLAAFVVLNIVVGGPWLHNRWRRRLRYRELRALRNRRAQTPATGPLS